MTVWPLIRIRDRLSHAAHVPFPPPRDEFFPSALTAGQPAAAVAPPPATPLRFLALFDDLDTSDTDLIQARDAADRYFAANLQPGDRVGIFTSGKTLCDFTSDPKQIHEAIAKLHANPQAARMPGYPVLSDYQALQITRGDGEAMAVALMRRNATPGSWTA